MQRNETRVARLAMVASALLAGTIASKALPAMPALHYSLADFARVRKFDAHVHINAAPEAFAALAKRDGFNLLTINVDYPDFPTIDRQAAIAETLHRAHPSQVQFATTFSMKGWGEANWASRTNGRLTTAIKAGAVAVKVWKNIGMIEKDATGRLIMIDNPAFDPVIAHIMALDVPLIGHQGEPKNCWLPLDEMTTENDRSYFKEHPQYHIFLHPDQPSYEEQMGARDAFLARHPALRFVGAHMASLEWSVDRLAIFFDAHPKAVVDLAARMTQVQYQSAADRAKVRAFFIKYQDRLMYGSDASINPTDKVRDTLRDTDNAWRSDWQYLATPTTQNIADLKKRVQGLGLPRAVINKIYWNNAQRVYLGKGGN
jgi:predicted TIM-barrel fold metal-dependent hydrolase